MARFLSTRILAQRLTGVKGIIASFVVIFALSLGEDRFFSIHLSKNADSVLEIIP